MSSQQDQLVRLQSALAQLSAPPTTNAILYPGPERYSIFTFLLQKLLSPDIVQMLQQRISDADLPGGLSAEEAQAHRLVRMLQCVDLHVPVDHVRGCTASDDALRILTALANLALAHQLHIRDAAVATFSSANGSTPTAATAAATSGRTLSPGAAAAAGPSTTPRHQHTPGRNGIGAGAGQSEAAGGVGGNDPRVGGGGGGRPLLSLQSLEGEIRLLDGLVERLPQLLEPGGGGNLFPGDIMAALQASYLSGPPTPSDLAAAVEQRATRLRAELPGLRAGEAQLAEEVTVAGEEEWRRHAEATRGELSALLDTSADFYHTFQTGLGVWCAASRAADTCGLGPLATDLLQRYDSLRRLGADLGRVRQAHSALVGCAPPLTLLEQHSLSQLVRASQAAVEGLQHRIAAETRVTAETELAAAVAAARARGLVALPTAAGAAIAAAAT